MTQLLAKFSSIVKENQPLAPFTWLQIGGPSRFLIEPNTVEEFAEIVGICSQEGIPVRMLGGGSNLLVRESGFNGATVLLSSPAFSQIQHSGTNVTCGAGTKLSHLITYCVGLGLAGLEHLVAIPEPSAERCEEMLAQTMARSDRRFQPQRSSAKTGLSEKYRETNSH